MLIHKRRELIDSEKEILIEEGFIYDDVSKHFYKDGDNDMFILVVYQNYYVIEIFSLLIEYDGSFYESLIKETSQEDEDLRLFTRKFR